MSCCAALGGSLVSFCRKKEKKAPSSSTLSRCRCSLAVPEESSSSVVSVDDNSRIRRRLILLRHAHSASSFDRPSRDHDRTISKVGRRDAANVSTKLREMGWVPQLILSSDATRTRETLQIMRQQEEGFLKAEVHFMPSFYSVAAMDGQTAEHIQKAICQYSSDEILTVMCMGHNKGWEEAATVLSGTAVALNTCNAALLESKGSTWKEAFSLAGFGGWKLCCIVKPDSAS